MHAAELAVSNGIKDEFLSIVSHELRTPINVISGYTRLVSDGSLGEVSAGQSNALDTVSRCTSNLLTTIETIMEATKFRPAPRQWLTMPFRSRSCLSN